MTTSPPLDTTVITLDPVDYGAGRTDRVVFAACRFRVDENGTLRVYKQATGEPDVATFAPGHWASVIRGVVVALGSDEVHPSNLTVVRSAEARS